MIKGLKSTCKLDVVLQILEQISQIDCNSEIRSFKSCELKYKMFKIVVVSP